MRRQAGAWPKTGKSRLACFVSTREADSFGATAARLSSRRGQLPCCIYWPSGPKNSSPKRTCWSVSGAVWRSAMTHSPLVFRNCAVCSATTRGTPITSRPGTGEATVSWCRPRWTNKAVLPRHCWSRHPNLRDWSGGSPSSASLRTRSIRRGPAAVRSFSSAASRVSARAHLRTRFWSGCRPARRLRSRTANVSIITGLASPICP